MTSSETSTSYRHFFHHEEHVMGTVVTLDLYDDEPPSVLTLTPIVEEAIEVLHVADEMFSTWKETSCISRLRRGDLSLDEAPDDVKRVLELCEEARRVTHGWFDPWAMPGGVDPTGLVKGWAAQRCLDVLQRGNLGGAIVNAAGDIASFGGPKLGEPFRVGVVDPFDTRRLAYVVESPGAVATSGSYERGAHLIDPHSGTATTRAASATVVGRDLAFADALATALVIAGVQGLAMLSELSEYEGCVIADDGAPHVTSMFPLATTAPVSSR